MGNTLLKKVESLRNSGLRKLVDSRIREFEVKGSKPDSEIFKELCFCILTANYSAEKAIKIQGEVGDGFLVLPEPRLAGKLRAFGYRFPNTRAKYIVEARRHEDSLKKILRSYRDENELRDWLVKNVKGLGYKEASHFLRNIGFKNQAIIDFHIVDVLIKYGLIKKPKTLSKAKYLEIEKLLKKIAREIKLNLAELDLYLWYCETRKILK